MSDTNSESRYGSFLRKMAAVQGVTTVSLSATIYALQKSPTLSKQLVYMNWFRQPKIDFSRPTERQSMGLFTGVPRTQYVPVMSESGDTVPCWVTVPEREEGVVSAGGHEDEQAVAALRLHLQDAEERNEQIIGGAAGSPLLYSPLLSPLDSLPPLTPALSLRETACDCCISKLPNCDQQFSKDDKPVYVYLHGNCSHRGEPHRVMLYKHQSRRRYRVKGMLREVKDKLRKMSVTGNVQYTEDVSMARELTKNMIDNEEERKTAEVMQKNSVFTLPFQGSYLHGCTTTTTTGADITSMGNLPENNSEDTTVEWLIGGSSQRPSWLQRLVLPITAVRDTAYRLQSWDAQDSLTGTQLEPMAGPNGYVVSFDYRGFGDHVQSHSAKLDAWAETYKNSLSVCRWCKGSTGRGNARRHVVGAKKDPDLTPCAAGLHDDALAVYDWLVDDCHVDPKRIFLFGHSLGTAVTAAVMKTLQYREQTKAKEHFHHVSQAISELYHVLFESTATDKTSVLVAGLQRALSLIRGARSPFCGLPAGIVLEAPQSSVFDVVLEKPPFSLLTPTELQDQASNAMRERREWVQAYRREILAEQDLCLVEELKSHFEGTSPKHAMLQILRDGLKVHSFDAQEHWLDVGFSTTSVTIYNGLVQAIQQRLAIVATMLIPITSQLPADLVGAEVAAALRSLGKVLQTRESVNVNFHYPAVAANDESCFEGYHELLEQQEYVAVERSVDDVECGRVSKLISMYECESSNSSSNSNSSSSVFASHNYGLHHRASTVALTGTFPILLLHGKLDYVIKASHSQRLYRLLSQMRAHSRNCTKQVLQYLSHTQHQLHLVQDGSFEMAPCKLSLPCIDKVLVQIVNTGLCLYPMNVVEAELAVPDNAIQWTEHTIQYTADGTHASVYAAAAEHCEQVAIEPVALPYTLVLPQTTALASSDSIALQVVDEAHHDNLITFDLTKLI